MPPAESRHGFVRDIAFVADRVTSSRPTVCAPFATPPSSAVSVVGTGAASGVGGDRLRYDQFSNFLVGSALDGNTSVSPFDVSLITNPSVTEVIQGGVFGNVDPFAAVSNSLISSVTGPILTGNIERCIFRDLYPNAPLPDLSIPPVASPVVSRNIQRRIVGNIQWLTSLTDLMVTTITSPVVPGQVD